ncbi:MAG: HPr family phosphocarrier protein [bacterium]
MIQRVVKVRNELGLHARAAANLVKLTARFESEIKLSRPDHNQRVDGKSILGILLLAAAKGTELQLTVDGKDEEEALETIVNLFGNLFGEAK